VTLLALAQCEVSGAVPTVETVRASGARVREQMAAAASLGARLVHFPEGTLGYPHKKLLQSWDVVPWDALEAIAVCAAELGIWTVVGAPHRLSGGRRPHNSLYVIADGGDLVTRYDKRRLSTTEVARLYTPGTDAITFQVDGVRIGLALCLETIFPELFVSYALDGADAVIVSSAPDTTSFARMVEGHAAMNGITVGLVCAAGVSGSRSGVASMHGWAARTDDHHPCVIVAQVDRVRTDGGREFHRRARTDLYDGLHADGDPRSVDRRSF
jgi:predicted amidohydrolase